jgi:hypothetical protein
LNSISNLSPSLDSWSWCTSSCIWLYHSIPSAREGSVFPRARLLLDNFLALYLTLGLHCTIDNDIQLCSEHHTYSERSDRPPPQ